MNSFESSDRSAHPLSTEVMISAVMVLSRMRYEWYSSWLGAKAKGQLYFTHVGSLQRQISWRFMRYKPRCISFTEMSPDPLTSINTNASAEFSKMKRNRSLSREIASFSEVPIPGRLAVRRFLVSFTQSRNMRCKLKPEILSMLSSTRLADCFVWKLRIDFLRGVTGEGRHARTVVFEGDLLGQTKSWERSFIWVADASRGKKLSMLSMGKLARGLKT
mmetsp:Transcript_8452/g.19158  ORF Transcript_8452/g.19158 Transcript_8452/m.19158 type:complete len:218 (-) Transcript_8452:135-788(-)